MDVEIKFRLGDVQFDVDVQKDQIEKLKDLYKALLRISETTYENSVVTSLANESLAKAVAILQNSRTEELKLSEQYKELTEFGFNWLTSIREQYHEKDFGDVFEKYINN